MKLASYLALTCGVMAQRDSITDKCAAEFTEKITEGNCSRYVEYTFDNTKLKPEDGKHTISFNYNVEVTNGKPTFHGHLDIKGCCRTETTSTMNLGGGKYKSGNQRDHFRVCVEISKEGQEF
jgi:hypothetical protein